MSRHPARPVCGIRLRDGPEKDPIQTRAGEDQRSQSSLPGGLCHPAAPGQALPAGAGSPAPPPAPTLLSGGGCELLSGKSRLFYGQRGPAETEARRGHTKGQFHSPDVGQSGGWAAFPYRYSW